MSVTASPRNRLPLALTVVVAIGLVAAIGVWWFLRNDEPAAVSLDAATERVADAADATEASGSDGRVTAEQPAADGVAGVWTVDTETGEFDYESATGSFVGFRIEEELRAVGSTTAVGRTGTIDGALTIEGDTVVEAGFEVDLTTITTETSNRDDNVQDALETAQFPTASFALTAPIELGTGAADGEAVTATAEGDLTIHGVTRPVEFALDAQLVDETIVVVGSTLISFADFDVEVPNGGPVISVDDVGVVELQLLFTR
ncbi:MAG: YceI family protein [Actinomycetota bacterium]